MSGFIARILAILIEKLLAMLVGWGFNYYNEKVNEAKNKKDIKDAFAEKDRRRAAERLNDVFR